MKNNTAAIVVTITCVVILVLICSIGLCTAGLFLPNPQ